MPTSTRREKLAVLNNALEACHKSHIGYRTPAVADRVAEMLQPLGFGQPTEREYVRLIVDALAWEEKNRKEFRFAE